MNETSPHPADVNDSTDEIPEPVDLADDLAPSQPTQHDSCAREGLSRQCPGPSAERRGTSLPPRAVARPPDYVEVWLEKEIPLPVWRST